MNSSAITIDDFLHLRKVLPLVDVRSESEFHSGHIPGAKSLPILNDQERVSVGTDYKQKGQSEAIRTGFRLVGPRLEVMINEAGAFADNRELLVYCWRGGMRSKNFCSFVSMAGLKTHRLEGGYKVYRDKVFESFSRKLPILVIGGKTGSGKSEILRALENSGEQVIDLERMANHKGSAFGGLLQLPQPTNEQFLNSLFEKIHSLDFSRPVWVEDESISIGKIFLPREFFDQKMAAPVIQIEVEKSVRVNRLVQEYGPADRNEFLQAMEKIIKKLGGQNFNVAKEQLLKGDMHATIDLLLTYYDKAYAFSLDKKSAAIRASYPWDGGNIGSLIHQLTEFSSHYQAEMNLPG